MADQPPSPTRPQSPFSALVTNLIINIALPIFILSKMSHPDRLGPLWAMLVALSLPLGYLLFALAKTRRTNLISVLGMINILFSGGFGLLQLDGFWFAVKDSTIPALLGLAVVGSLKTKYPLVRTFLFNEQVFNTQQVEKELHDRGHRDAFQALLLQTTWIIAAAFLLSSVLHFVLARMILKSPAGTAAFTQELGHLKALSYPFIALPATVVLMFGLWRLVTQISHLTGLSVEDILKSPPTPQKDAARASEQK